MKKIYFVRHGQAEHNVTGVFTDADVSLTKLGREQALGAAHEIKKLDDRIAAIIASPMARTKETAQIIAAELGFSPKHITRDERIRELKHGKFVGIPVTPEGREKRKRLFLTKNNELGVEWIGDLVQRVDAFAAGIRQRPEEVILVVGHNFTGRMLRRILGDQEHTKPMQRLKTAEAVQLYPYIEASPDVEKIL